MRAMARRLAAITFGIILPIILLYTAFCNLQDVSKKLYQIESEQGLQKAYEPLKGILSSANDYILYSLMYVEQSNQRTMVNKQAMKLTIIHIGFAIMCVGIMFVVLGINDGGAQGVGEFGGGTFNLKTASSGFAIFIGGALMASGGALLNNQYATAAVPGYIQVLTQADPPPDPAAEAAATRQHVAWVKENQLIQFYKKCRAYDDTQYAQCLAGIVPKLYSEEIK